MTTNAGCAACAGCVRAWCEVTRNFKVGYQIHPQHCTIDQIREAYRAADALGVDTIWVWDHMYPLYGDGGGNHYASTPILAAMAVETRSAHLGALVASNSYRNHEFYAYEVAAIDHLGADAVGQGVAEKRPHLVAKGDLVRGEAEIHGATFPMVSRRDLSRDAGVARRP